MESDIYQVYEDEIHSLEEEIEMLIQKFENKQESTFYSDEEIQISMYAFYIKSLEGESKRHESPPDLKAELDCLESDLSFLMKFTGVWFTNYSKETVEKTGNKTIQKHRLSGTCYSLTFQMEFQLLEIQSNESISAVVTDLSIIMECGEYSDLSKFVSSAEERGNLLIFFRSLSSFAEWCEHRKCTFKHFKVVCEKTFCIFHPLSFLNVINKSFKMKGQIEHKTNPQFLPQIPKWPPQGLNSQPWV
uniref:Centromere protein P n=1 Tax=Chelydra serpentina TaxID=8475 RepID=A0A8C3SG91_CHESE